MKVFLVNLQPVSLHSCEKKFNYNNFAKLHFALIVQNNTRTISDQDNEIKKEEKYTGKDLFSMKRFHKSLMG